MVLLRMTQLESRKAALVTRIPAPVSPVWAGIQESIGHLKAADLGIQKCVAVALDVDHPTGECAINHRPRRFAGSPKRWRSLVCGQTMFSV